MLSAFVRPARMPSVKKYGEPICIWPNPKSVEYRKKLADWNRLYQPAHYVLETCHDHGVKYNVQYMHAIEPPDLLETKKEHDDFIRKETGALTNELNEKHISMSHDEFCDSYVRAYYEERFPNPITRPVILPSQ